ncbi:MAG: agmatinase, partial [Acidobacteriota bacterium]
EARAVILPVPYERTTSYGAGTENGPRAILEASAYVELYDEELKCEPCEVGLWTAPPCRSDPGEDLEEALKAIERAASGPLETGQFLVTLGGEHGLTTGPARAARSIFGDVGVVQFDAHADLRDSYEGSIYSHASVMRRLVDDLGMPSLAVGLRSLSLGEARLIESRGLPVLWSREVHEEALRDSTRLFEQALEALPERVYLTFDVDYFDPALLPATGTPEPGGGTWHPTLSMLKKLFERKSVVAMDVVELAPNPASPSSDFVAAKLIYKALGYRFFSSPSRAP